MTTAGGDPPSSGELAAVGLLELLKEDHRPSCIVDLDHSTESKSLPQICFRNARFREEYDFEASNHGANSADDERLYFRSWALSRITQDSRSTVNCYGLTWVTTTVRKRWKVIQAATPAASSSDDSDSDTSHHDLKHAGVLRNLPKGSCEAHHEWLRVLMQKASPHDWTAANKPRRISDHVEFVRNWDWSKTFLGPMESWSPRLRLMANLIMVDPNPAVLFWGPELIGIYNEPYVPLLHDKHPKALGEPYHKTWVELYRQEEVATVLDDLWMKNVKGEPILWVRRTFYLRNGNRLQEHIFNVSFLPIIDEDGKTVAFYEPVKEVTRDALNERRSENIRKISELTAGEDNLSSFYQKVLAALEPNDNDFPFAMLYSLKSFKVDWKRPFMLNHAIDNGLAKLESFMGVRVAERNGPAVQHLLMRNQCFLDTFDEVCRSGRIDTFCLESRPEIQTSIVPERPTRGFGDEPWLSVLIPIESIAHKGVNAVLFVGTNTRRPYDADYEAFMADLARAISSSLAALILTNEQKRRVGEALQMEQRAVSMLEASPVGSALLNMQGTILYANSSWHRITGYSFDTIPFSWLEMMIDESAVKAQKEWGFVVGEQRLERTFELALKKPWSYTDSATGEVVKDGTHVLVSALVQRIGEEDFVISVVTDISYQKWMESLQDQRRQQALDMKRAQENFMDMTSHEMRNPLSAIFQCADAIVSSLSAYQKNGYGMPDLSPTSSQGSQQRRTGLAGTTSGLDEAIAHAIENAGTITLCAQHQRRIVDDVLVLSKVDANLIEIHPVEVQPRVLIQNTIKMFAAELAANKAQMTLEMEPSFQELQVDWVTLDPGRLLQILINLCTNAIKFSMDSHIRKISIQVAASATIPNHSSRGVRYLHGVNEEAFEDPTTKPEWGSGEILYLQFQVTDRGQGMTMEEMQILFQRFKQASPKTHTQYGGSGLGLFIARLLSRLQGGEIGVTSTAGKGTTFAFYIKVRRAKTPHGTDVHAVVPQVNLPVGGHGPDSPSVLSAATTRLKDPSEVSILIVEDNVVNQRVLSRQLKTQGFTVAIANNGAESLDFIKKSEHWTGTPNQEASSGPTHPHHPLSVILMDIEMPVMNGTEAASRIREFEKSGALLRHIPIIAITANARMEQIAVAKDAGMDEVVSKPFRIPELLAKIETFVGPLEKSGS